MDYDVRWIDQDRVYTGERHGEPPVHIHDRSDLMPPPDTMASAVASRQRSTAGDILIAQSPVNQANIDWSVDRSSDNLRIPVYAYRTVRRGGSPTFATGLELGGRIIRDLLGGDVRPAKIWLFIGKSVTDLQDQGQYRVYLGLAIKPGGS